MATLHLEPHRRNPLRVAIVGLKPRQANVVSQSVGNHLDLRFMPSSRRPGFPAGCALIVLMTKFISHAWQTEAKNRFSSEKIHLHHGGITKLIRWLRRLCGE